MVESQNDHIVTVTVKFLLEYKADVYLLDNSGWSSLIVASYKGRIDIVKLLLEYTLGILFHSYIYN